MFFYDRSKAGLAWIHVDSRTGRKKTLTGRKKHFASDWLDADFLSREIKSGNLRLFLFATGRKKQIHIRSH